MLAIAIGDEFQSVHMGPTQRPRDIMIDRQVAVAGSCQLACNRVQAIIDDLAEQARADIARKRASQRRQCGTHSLG